MLNEEVREDRKIFIFNKLRTSHDMLYKIIDLDREYTDFTPYLSAERILGFETISLYILYNGNNFQYIEYKIDSSIVPISRTEAIVVDPTDRYSFVNKQTNHNLFPLKTEESQVSLEVIQYLLTQIKENILIFDIDEKRINATEYYEQKCWTCY